MQSEEFDKKIIEAAAHHHPVYNEKGWAEMNQLLDKHLPQEKERKRRFIFWFIVPLLLVGTGFLVTKLVMKKNPVAKTAATGKNDVAETGNTKAAIPGTTPTTTGEGVDATSGKPTDINTQTDDVVAVKKPAVPPITDDVATKSNTNIPAEKRMLAVEKKMSSNKETNEFDISSYSSKKKKIQKDKANSVTEKATVVTKTTELQPVTVVEVPAVSSEKEMSSRPLVAKDMAKEQVDEKDISANKKDAPATATIDKNKETVPAIAIEEKKNKDIVAATTPEKQPDSSAVKDVVKKKSKAKNVFFAGASFGGDMSFVGGNKTGSLKSVVGVGVGYTYNNRITLRTGFYSGRKIYSATADSYDPPAAFLQFYPYLQKVDANCKIYEIPILLSWNFGKGPDKHWFVSSGVSTLLMKKETYNYFYKYTPTGNTYSQEWTIKNENYHYFSVVTLSAGYQRSIGKRMIFMAEPYLKIPVAGVGFGRVKLNSAGVLFTVGIKPFK